MRRAIVLAKRGEGYVEPNPMVGCVIAKGDRVVGEGYHRRFGGPHAEIVALRACSTPPRGATVYVSLEPCCHQGKTPPCADALIEAGVSRVVVACRDPNPQVDGGGIERLRRAGIHVELGVCETEAAELLAPYLTRTILNRPYVIAKWAQSLDGKLATRTGDSKWISNEASRRIVHRLRARVDAILVGVNTVLRDDPLLTARDVRLRRIAVRAVLDSRLRIPMGCQLVATARSVPTLVFTSKDQQPSAKARRLERAGVEVVGCRMQKNRVSVRDCLRHLSKTIAVSKKVGTLSSPLTKGGSRGVLGSPRNLPRPLLVKEGGTKANGLVGTDTQFVTNLMIEGGPSVLSSFLQAGVVDEAWVFTAPMLIGSNAAPGVLDTTGATEIASAIKPRRLEHRRVDGDSFDRLWLTDPPRIVR